MIGIFTSNNITDAPAHKHTWEVVLCPGPQGADTHIGRCLFGPHHLVLYKFTELHIVVVIEALSAGDMSDISDTLDRGTDNSVITVTI